MNDSVCEVFLHAADDAFSYLAHDHGFREVERRRVGVECWLMLASPKAGVRVIYEPGSPIRVDLLLVGDSDVGSFGVRDTSSLDMLLEDKAPQEAIAHSAIPNSELEVIEAVRRAADMLRRFGADFIAGDFQGWPRLKALAEANLRRRSKDLFGKAEP